MFAVAGLLFMRRNAVRRRARASGWPAAQGEHRDLGPRHALGLPPRAEEGPAALPRHGDPDGAGRTCSGSRRPSSRRCATAATSRSARGPPRSTAVRALHDQHPRQGRGRGHLLPRPVRDRLDAVPGGALDRRARACPRAPTVRRDPLTIALRTSLVLSVAWLVTSMYTLSWYDLIAWMPLAVIGAEQAGPADDAARSAPLSLAYVPGRAIDVGPALRSRGSHRMRGDVGFRPSSSKTQPSRTITYCYWKAGDTVSRIRCDARSERRAHVDRATGHVGHGQRRSAQHHQLVELGRRENGEGHPRDQVVPGQRVHRGDQPGHRQHQRRTQGDAQRIAGRFDPAGQARGGRPRNDPGQQEGDADQAGVRDDPDNDLACRLVRKRSKKRKAGLAQEPPTRSRRCGGPGRTPWAARRRRPAPSGSRLRRTAAVAFFHSRR